ncbi:hypothetical protein YC2023_016226 [Brassica napus]
MGARSHGEISYQISTLWFFRHKEHSCHDNGNNRREPVYAEERKLGELYGLVARTAIGCYDSCYPDLAQLDFVVIEKINRLCFLYTGTRRASKISGAKSRYTNKTPIL